MKLKTNKLGSVILAVLLSSPPAVATGIPVVDGLNIGQNTITAIQEVASVIKQVQEYKTQLEQYKIQIQDNASSAQMFFSDIENTLKGLESAQNQLKNYKKTIDGIDQYLKDFQVTDFYRKSPCFAHGYCTPEEEIELKKKATEILKMKQLANDGLIETVSKQIDSVSTDNKRLSEMAAKAKTPQGTTEAIQNLTEFAEMQNAQLLQIRTLLNAQAQINAQVQQEKIAEKAAQEALFERNRKMSTFNDNYEN